MGKFFPCSIFKDSSVKRRVAVICICFIPGFSCLNPESPAGGQAIQIPVNPAEAGALALSDVFTNIVYIPLETRKEGMVDYMNIDKVYFDGDMFYIFEIDGSLARRLFIFDKSGKYLSKIEGAQDGIEGFPTGEDFIVDARGQIIEVLDRYRKRVVQYDASGKFSGYKRLENVYQQFVKIKDTYIFHSGNESKNGKNLFYTDINGKNLKSFMEIPEYFHDFDLSDKRFSLSVYKDTYLLWDLFSRKIHRISANGVQLAYEIANEKEWIKDDQIRAFARSGWAGRLDILNRKDSIVGVSRLLEWKNFVYFIFSYQGNIYWNFFDKRSGKVTSLKVKGSPGNCLLANDYDHGLTLSVPHGMHEDDLVFLLYPGCVEEHMAHIQSSNFSISAEQEHRYAYLLSKLGGISHRDNPVMALARLKPELL
jgi:hypothetical protein